MPETPGAYLDDKEKGEQMFVEDVDSLNAGKGQVQDAMGGVLGTVDVVGEDGGIVLIPTPSSDPRDPLNMPQWRKWTMLIILSLFSCIANCVISGGGALISFFLASYIEAGKGYQDIVNLITVPTLSMGLGNLIFVPLALAIGRRPVYLGSLVLLVCGSIIASQNTNYEYHLAIRVVLGFAAGQSEALIPLMIKETFFLHERAAVLSFQAALQTIVGCVLTIFGSNIAAGVGWKNWYLVYAGLSAFILIVSVPLVAETKFDRAKASYAGLTGTTAAATTSQTDAIIPKVTQATRPQIDGKRTLKYDLHPAPAKVEWSESWLTLKHMGQMVWFPNVFLIILMNSWYLGVNIGVGTTYATVLEAPPYNWLPKWAGVAQAGQIVVAFACLPLLGWGSDWLITRMAKKNNGVHEPEVRLITLGLPIVIGVVSTVLFGYTWDNPEKVHWFSIIFAYSGSYFAFIAASVAGQCYLLDAYPTRSGTVLVLVCACRGLISFGLTYSLTPTTDALGHTKAYGMYAGVMAILGLCGIWLYFGGKKLRLWTLKFVKNDVDDDKPHYG